MLKALRPSLFLLLQMTFLLGVVYPSGVWVAGHLFFPRQAAGSLMIEKGRLVGSELIGQSFSDPAYFWPRPSATAPKPYDFLASGGSQMDPANPRLKKEIKARLLRLRGDAPPQAQIPIDLVTASGSGLDPHISPQAALIQIDRIAQERGIEPYRLRYLVLAYTEGRTLGFLGEKRVNVLLLNLALDKIKGGRV